MPRPARARDGERPVGEPTFLTPRVVGIPIALVSLFRLFGKKADRPRTRRKRQDEGYRGSIEPERDGTHGETAPPAGAAHREHCRLWPRSPRRPPRALDSAQQSAEKGYVVAALSKSHLAALQAVGLPEPMSEDDVSRFVKEISTPSDGGDASGFADVFSPPRYWRLHAPGRRRELEPRARVMHATTPRHDVPRVARSPVVLACGVHHSAVPSVPVGPRCSA